MPYRKSKIIAWDQMQTIFIAQFESHFWQNTTIVWNCKDKRISSGIGVTSLCAPHYFYSSQSSRQYKQLYCSNNLKFPFGCENMMEGFPTLLRIPNPSTSSHFQPFIVGSYIITANPLCNFISDGCLYLLVNLWCQWSSILGGSASYMKIIANPNTYLLCVRL